MDFDPHSIKWQCCCCSLPSGMRLLASAEFAFCAITASLAMYNIAQQSPEQISAAEVCLVGLMIFFVMTSIMLIIGIQRHSIQLIYPSLLSRGLAILFLAVFGVSAVFAHNSKIKRGDDSDDVDAANVAFKLVLCVFALLFLTVIIFYCCYLIVRLIHYEQSFARLKERRNSLIQAGMIDPDYPSPNNYSVSRRASSA